jgi:hypothetical protein
VKTLTVDDQQRVKLPNVAPRTKFAFEDLGGGVIRLTEVKGAPVETFPRGSLTPYLTPERDREQLAILSECVQAPE